MHKYQSIVQRCDRTGINLGLSRDEFISWGDCETYRRLFADWVKSGFDKWKCPSVDRIDDNLGYEPGNIQWLTWEQNYAKQVSKVAQEAGIVVKEFKVENPDEDLRDWV